jgi:parvulin-like peptidyl-prolyl isomerase
MRKMILLIIAGFLCITLNAYGIEDKVVAVVNNEVITNTELDSYIALFKLQYGYDGWLKLGMSEKEALEKLIEDRLVVQEAKKKGISIPERLIDAKIQEIKNRLGSQEQFSEFLSTQGMSLSELRERIIEKMLSDKLIDMEIRSRILISPNQVTKYYQEHTNDFISPERIDLENIVVKDKNLAFQIYERLKEGKDFLEFKEKYSEQSGLGVVERGQLLKEIEDEIFNLGAGQFSKPLEISGQYYIFLIKEKLSSSNISLTEVQSGIRNMLLNEQFIDKLDKFINKLREQSYIVIKYE